LGEAQTLQAAGWLESRRHSKDAMPEPEPSLAENSNFASAEPLGVAGWPPIDAGGGVVSTLQPKAAADPALPALSIALTSKLCAPSLRPE
jgi:hypothetical protein